jgi:hypothetical protein
MKKKRSKFSRIPAEAGRKLRVYMEDNALSVRGFSASSGVSEYSVYRFLRAEYEHVTKRNNAVAQKIATEMGLTLTKFFRKERPPVLNNDAPMLNDVVVTGVNGQAESSPGKEMSAFSALLNAGWKESDAARVLNIGKCQHCNGHGYLGKNS